MEHLTRAILHLVDVAGYPGVFLAMLLGNIGLPAGTEFVAATAGALAATGHLSSAWLAATVATVGELAGASISYAVGYVGGRPFVDRYGKYLKLDAHAYDRLHAYFERYGAATIFVCRFIPVVRGYSSLPAGVSRMDIGPFYLFTAIGSAIFCFGLVALGNAFGSHLDTVAPFVHRFSLAIAAIVVLAAVAYAVKLVRSKPA